MRAGGVGWDEEFEGLGFGRINWQAGVASSQIQLQSGGGQGFDYFTLIFNFADGVAQAMAPTVANLGSLNVPSTTVVFGVQQDEVAIQNPVYPDTAGSWAPVYTQGFLSQGVTDAVVDKSKMVAKADAVVAQA